MTKNPTNLVTKEYLDKKLDQVNERIDKVEGSLVDLKVSVMGELKPMRKDNDVRLYLHQTTTDSLDTVNDTLGDHERRLKKLEKPTL